VEPVPTGFSLKKVLLCPTCGGKGGDGVQNEETGKVDYQVRCPHCNGERTLNLRGIDWLWLSGDQSARPLVDHDTLDDLIEEARVGHLPVYIDALGRGWAKEAKAKCVVGSDTDEWKGPIDPHDGGRGDWSDLLRENIRALPPFIPASFLVPWSPREMSVKVKEEVQAVVARAGAAQVPETVEAGAGSTTEATTAPAPEKKKRRPRSHRIERARAPEGTADQTGAANEPASPPQERTP
jgi:hypothetical protein